MQFTNLSTSDVYGTFSSAEQAEYDSMRDKLPGAAFYNVGSLDLGDFSFPSSMEGVNDSSMAICGEQNQQNLSFPVPEYGQREFDSLFSASLPTSPCQSEVPSTVSPRDIQLSIPEGGSYSSLPYLSPVSSCSSVPSPLTPDNGDAFSNTNGMDAPGLFENLLFLDSVVQPSSSALSFPHFTPTGAVIDFVPTSYMTVDQHSLFPQMTISAAQLLNDSVFPSPAQNCFSVDCAQLPTLSPIPEVNVEPEAPPLDVSSHAPAERSYPSPSPTPTRPAATLPAQATRKKKANKVRATRAVAARRKTCRQPSVGPLAETPSSSCGSEKALTIATASGSDVCEYGTRVWVDDKRGRRVAKWKCGSCGTVIGRRPDLHRHHRICVKREKFFCIDVILVDGSVWPGCGQVFSRQDACHRHLKKRFTHGHCCSRSKPKKSNCRSVDEYEAKLVAHSDFLAEAGWRAALPAEEKNRLVRTALARIKQDMF